MHTNMRQLQIQQLNYFLTEKWSLFLWLLIWLWAERYEKSVFILLAKLQSLSNCGNRDHVPW